MRKYLTIILLAIISFTGLRAANDYTVIEKKATRFYNEGEWASALAMYHLMLDEQPEVALTYPKAIVAAVMIRDTDSEKMLVEQSMRNAVPIDSLLTGVQRESFQVGCDSLYENFLKRVQTDHPWLRRGIDSYLLRYYMFRHDAPNIITYSNLLLQGLPDNITYLASLAYGYMLDGQEDKGVDTYKYILTLNPSDQNALIELGNYYYKDYRHHGNNESRELAAGYLKQAYNIRPTPYIAQLLENL
jgi:tetratricopeptide (TPR) repeat protein